jgi:hypothetical protein
LVLIKKSKNCLSIQKLAVAFIGYMALGLLMSLSLQGTANLSTWNPTFPLLLGNERTGNRAWQGFISELSIADRAISEAEVAKAFADEHLFLAAIKDSLIASYQLTGKSYPDRTGHLPNLFWHGQPPNVQAEAGVFLSRSHWLETLAPATFMTQRLRETSQFTLATTVATSDLAQTGPARIISLSGGPYHRNFTLGQERTNLVFRLQTPLTGENGNRPEMIVPHVFVDTKPHHLIITYELTPGVALFGSLFRPTSSTLKGFNILYYGLLFIPLGSLLALLSTILRDRIIFQILLFCGGILLPPLLLEAILAISGERTMKLENLLLSITIMVGTMLIVKTWTGARLKSNRLSLHK